MNRFPPLLAAAALLVAAPAAAQPAVTTAPIDAAQAALGRRLAEAGELNALLGAVGTAEVAQIAASTPDLSDAERTRLREVGMATLQAGRARITAALGDAYARHFSRDQLTEILAFVESTTGRAYAGALLQVLPQVVGAIQGVDLGRDIRAAFCRETGKLCAPR
ncbi:MAG TPA: DUF2059 domain-containing protein [Allosphingosinicella sp.]|nr:DUF2059 domain-containing protein [Allosphingosinicella sp.]